MSSLPYILVAYLLGSIPFGLLLSHFAGMGDIRKIGSGNIGATNVLRTGNKKIALLTLLFDALKGYLAVLMVLHYAPSLIYVAGLAAILGHVFPVWLKFKGGKGVATALGVYLSLNAPLALMIIFIWSVVAKIWKISSLAALVALALAPVLAFLLVVYNVAEFEIVSFSCVITLLILYTHRENIKRLFSGQEGSFKAE